MANHRLPSARADGVCAACTKQPSVTTDGVLCMKCLRSRLRCFRYDWDWIPNLTDALDGEDFDPDAATDSDEPSRDFERAVRILEGD